MNIPDFRSALAEPFARFLGYKRALNRKYRTEAGALRLFDAYLCEHASSGVGSIPSTLIEDFLKSRPRTRPRSYNHLLGVLHRFFAWAVLQQLSAQNPVTAQRRRDSGSRIPFIFDLSQARRLLQVAHMLPDNPRAPCRALTYETVFAMLYGLGLRVGEVARLKLRDVDFVQDLLFIRDTKFSKSRWVPFGPNLGERLRRYIDQRYGQTRDPEWPLFAFFPGQGIRETTFSQVFQKLVTQLKIDIPPGVSRPCLHTLRHSFAVGTLLRWYREGIDPNRRLMHLATFLGHVDPTSTSVYLTVTEDLLREADQRFRTVAPKVGAP